MRKIRWNIAASIGLIVLSQTASAAPDSNPPATADVSVYFSVTLNGPDISFGLDKASLIRLAQASPPPSPATPAPAESKAPDAPTPPAASSPAASGTMTAPAIKPAASVPGCALRYLAAEVSGKLKGRKWKQFRQEECGASETTAVFPTSIAPKYAGEKPDKAMTLTCADQFKANKADKAADANGGLKWIEKSGGYYSECIVRLKG
jgi:hypothetical protein